jgi:endonuclease YncB( thermonuclease family)
MGWQKWGRVRIANFDATELNEWGGASAKQNLKDLIEGEDVELKNAVNISYGRLVCDVYYNGQDIKELLS